MTLSARFEGALCPGQGVLGVTSSTGHCDQAAPGLDTAAGPHPSVSVTLLLQGEHSPVGALGLSRAGTTQNRALE